MVKTLVLHPILTDKEIEKKEGSYFPESHYKHMITSDCDVYGYNDNGNNNKQLLIKFRKGVIPQTICKNAFIALEKHAKHRNHNRGAAAGRLNLKRLPKYIGKITKRDNFRIFYKTRDGKKTRDNIGNMAMSNIAGYYDKPDRNEYQKMKLKHTRKASSITNSKTHVKRGYDALGVPMCRTTQFTKEEIDKWSDTIPLIIEADKHFKRLIPDRHAVQLQRANKTPQYQIEKTAYSTITLNYDWRTALHKDKGDLDEGFGNLIVLEKDKSGFADCPGYKGGFIGFPKWGVAVDVRQGDFLAMDVHQWHCNTPINGTGRLSVVCYLRKGMLKCAKS
jgi:hypothetical protein